MGMSSNGELNKDRLEIMNENNSSMYYFWCLCGAL